MGARDSAPVTCPASPNPKKGKGTRCAGCLRSKYPRRGPAPSLPPAAPGDLPRSWPGRGGGGRATPHGGCASPCPRATRPPARRLPGNGNGARRCGGTRLANPGECLGVVQSSPSPVSPPPLPPGSHNLPFYHRRSHQLHRPAPPPAQARTGPPAPPPAGERSGHGPQRRSAGSRCGARSAARGSGGGRGAGAAARPRLRLQLPACGEKSP